MTGSLVLSLRASLGQFEIPFNVLRVASGLASSGIASEEVILLGDIEGKVHLVQPLADTKERIVLETKGSSIQSLYVHPITKLSRNDLLAGDAQGVLTLFSNLELLSRESLPYSISAMTVTTEKEGMPRIFAGDRGGSLLSLGGLDLAIISSCSLPESPKASIPYERKIKFLETIQIPDAEGTLATYVIAVDGSPFLHIFSPGQVHVRSIPAPAKISGICVGNFTEFKPQVIISCSNRCLYVVQELQEISLFAETGHVVSKILPFKVNSLPFDVVACCGHWNGVKIFHNKLLEDDFQTLEWVHTMDMINLPSQEQCICIGQEDNTILLLNIKKKQIDAMEV